MKRALIVLCHARADYFERTIRSVLGQRMGGPDMFGGFDVFVSQDGLCEGGFAVHGRGHGQIRDTLDSLPGQIKTIKHEKNLGIARHYDFAERLLFEGFGYDYAVFCEDDTVLAPNYLPTLDRLVHGFFDDPRIGLMAAMPREISRPAAEQRARAGGYSLMGHNWAFAITRSFWEKRQPFVDAYLSLIDGFDYDFRPHDQIRTWLRAAGFPGAATSQDYVKSAACAQLGALRLSTLVNLGTPIGERGCNFNPELFRRLGYDRPVVFDGEVPAFEPLDDAAYKAFLAQDGHQVGEELVRLHSLCHGHEQKVAPTDLRAIAVS